MGHTNTANFTYGCINGREFYNLNLEGINIVNVFEKVIKKNMYYKIWNIDSINFKLLFDKYHNELSKYHIEKGRAFYR